MNCDLVNWRIVNCFNKISGNDLHENCSFGANLEMSGLDYRKSFPQHVVFLLLVSYRQLGCETLKMVSPKK